MIKRANAQAGIVLADKACACKANRDALRGPLVIDP